MKLRHVESIGQVTASRMVAGRKFVTLEVDYTTASGIQKTLKLAHSDAEAICKHVQEELSVMPRGARHASFWASFRRNR